jgi:hypothetical protein
MPLSARIEAPTLLRSDLGEGGGVGRLHDLPADDGRDAFGEIVEDFVLEVGEGDLVEVVAA